LKLANANALAAANAMTITSGTLDLNGQSSTLGLLNGSFGGTITTGTAGLITLTSSAAASSTYAGSINNGDGTIAFTKQGAGTLTLSGSNGYTGATTIQQGTLNLAHVAALSASTITPMTGGTMTLTPYLQTTVGGLDPNAGGLVDVGNGYVTVANGLSQLSLVAALQSGRAGGSWTGSSGITSSAAASAMASSTLRSVGWLDNGNGSMTFAYAAPGDSNLDWIVDVLDAGNFIAFGKFDTGLPATWIEGDFNYDATVDILDAADFFATGLYDTGYYNSPAGSIAAVPEPNVLGMFGVGAGVVGLLVMRRKRAA
jgi:autotransporter-associated beta strand protein